MLPEDAATTDTIIEGYKPGGRSRRDCGGAPPRAPPLPAVMTQFVQTLILGLLIGGVYALLASGLTLIFGVMRVINIAHGAFLILAAFLTYSIWNARPGSTRWSRSCSRRRLMFAFGWVLYLAAVRRIRGAHMSSSVLLTFALALVLEGLMGLIWGNTSHSVRPSYFNESFTIGDAVPAQGAGLRLRRRRGRARRRCTLILTRTWLGRAIRASAVNPQGAALVGRQRGRRGGADVRRRRRRPPAPAARSSACSIRSCPARTTSGSRAC